MKEKIVSSFLFLRGFIRMSTMIILLILLVTYYFYQDKIKEVSKQLYNENKESGTLFYATGIWNKAVGVQKRQEERNQNAFDLAGNTKLIKDKSNTFSIEIPESWNITTDQGKIGKQISKIVISNKSFLEHNIGNDIFYDNGAQFSIQVLSGELFDAGKIDSKHGKLLVSKKSTTMNGATFTYHIITDSNVKLGKIIDAHLLHAGKTIEFKFVFNEEKFNEGEFLFGEIMNSFKFIDGK